MENINHPFGPNNACLRYVREWKNRRGEAQLISIIPGDSRVRMQVEANRGETSRCDRDKANEVGRMNIN